ncbi:MAG: two-component system response regulator [Lachnospiraceae bacterium]|nr:two-component system response regulator [Lachnospiraceae bacterium]
MQERLNIIFVTGYEEYKADAMDLHASGYITKPVTERKLRAELKELRFPPQEEKGSRIRVQTFGNFEVFLDGHPAEFKYKKTKEMFAFMIDRHGASCTNGMLIDILWENEVDAGRKSSYLRNLRQDMVSAFSVHGLAEVIRMQRGAVAVNVDLVKCDYYEWLSGNRSGENEYRGEYMTQYSWAEETNAMLNFS